MPVLTKPLPSLRLLNELLIVDDVSPTGLIWKVSRSNRAKVGMPAGTKHSAGYWQVGITTDKRRLYLCHRIVYYMKTEIDPADNLIDHPTNVRTSNLDLRICNSQNNTRNRQKSKNGNKLSSDFKGVSWESYTEKWKAQICVDYKNINLGRFSTPEEAAFAYNKAAVKFFGEFAWLNKIN